ncbi:hypothetical protein AVI51_15395 [Piscirickettsia salmonis]|uniref:Z-ring associated protein G n=1 Tax=Piscirickettsia salmonis TaxID=1238 RepID=A0A9Q5V7Z0_PISSA|nr:DUF1043 family protein [Piscirickettsia salmonis]ALA24417.1 hypothetical protein KW89_949 [Piscirickettsia salmonis]APS44782.1 hypothetical protein AVI48_10680 [Piscirickettsia salmonis]APS48141.1 hypothetical protein AVI49_11285 [Piscirickettsia salmonis]APS52096.1 hypothetical protein AVI50_15545 [Piscirickettsia salmonis]APS55316.1 hypothetical protein AVI51_15395 [Piscirickettsia salmonis]
MYFAAIGLIALIIGLVIGYWWGRRQAPQKPNQLALELQNKAETYEIYQQTVEEHLNTAADLATALAQTQQELSEHIAQSLESLSQRGVLPPPYAESAATLKQAKKQQQQTTKSTEQPPRDYVT